LELSVQPIPFGQALNNNPLKPHFATNNWIASG